MRFKGIKIELILAGVFICAVSQFIDHTSAFSQELRQEGRNFVAEVHETFRVRDGGVLRLFDIRGDVEIGSWNQQTVEVTEIKRLDVFTREDAEEALRQSKTSYQQRDNTIEIAGDHYRRDWIRSNFVIKVPRKFNVDIETSGGDLAVRELAGEVRLKTSGGEIRLTDIDGVVDAKTSGGDIVVINSTNQVSLKTSGGELDLENIGGPILARTSGGDIKLTKSNERADLHTSGGDISIRDAGGDVKAHTSGGDIEIDNTKGPIEVHTSGGDVRIRNVGGSLDASTSGGDIRGSTIDGHADVSTSGGSIELQDVKGGVRAKTAGGDIAVEVTLRDHRKDHRIDLRTAGGEIVLFIPEDLPATIRAEIEITDRWEDYNIYSDFPLTSTEEADREDRQSRWRRQRNRRFIRSDGEINGGGDLIELFTTNGDIQINKLRR